MRRLSKNDLLQKLHELRHDAEQDAAEAKRDRRHSWARYYAGKAHGLCRAYAELCELGKVKNS